MISMLVLRALPLVVVTVVALLAQRADAETPLDVLFYTQLAEMVGQPCSVHAPRTGGAGAVETSAANGTLPAWLKGSIIKVGCGAFEMGTRNFTHAFDAFGKVHSFTLDGTTNTATFSTKFLQTALWTKSVAGGDISPMMTMQSPAPDFSWMQKMEGLMANNDQTNVNVVRASHGTAVVTTDTKALFAIGTEALDSRGDVAFDDALAKDGGYVISMAHPHVYERVATNGTQLGRYAVNAVGKMITLGKPAYALYRMPLDANDLITDDEQVVRTRSWRDGDQVSMSREQFGFVEVDPLCYMHSFAMTANYVALVCAPIHFDVGGLMEMKPLLETAVWNASLPTRVFVFDLESSNATAAPIASFEADAFFALHNINAFEVESSTASNAPPAIVFDAVAYKNADMLIGKDRFGDLTVMHDPERLKNIQPGEVVRCRIDLALPGSRCTCDVIAVQDASGQPLHFEVPRINPLVATQPYCWVYGMSVSNTDATVWTLVKANVCAPTATPALVWQRARHMPTEPVFIPRPGATLEDDGVVVSTVLDGDARESYLLVLDAQTMLPLAEVRLAGARGMIVPFAIHGDWFAA